MTQCCPTVHQLMADGLPGRRHQKFTFWLFSGLVSQSGSDMEDMDSDDEMEIDIFLTNLHSSPTPTWTGSLTNKLSLHQQVPIDQYLTSDLLAISSQALFFVDDNDGDWMDRLSLPQELLQINAPSDEDIIQFSTNSDLISDCTCNSTLNIECTRCQQCPDCCACLQQHADLLTLSGTQTPDHHETDFGCARRR